MFKKESKYQPKLVKVSKFIYNWAIIVPLAYMMAKTHGLTEFANTLEETLKTMDGIDSEKVLEEVETYAKKGRALLPLRPVFVGND